MTEGQDLGIREVYRTRGITQPNKVSHRVKVFRRLQPGTMWY